MFETRDFNGYHQTREVVGEKKYLWQFYVVGFGFDDISCDVLKTDGTTERVAITKQDQILISGQYYSRQSWTH